MDGEDKIFVLDCADQINHNRKIEFGKIQKYIEKLKAENKKLRDALSFYTDPEPKLTFEFIRNNLVPMKHVLIDTLGRKRLYLGFNREDELVTDDFTGWGSFTLVESTIEDWTYEDYNESNT